MHQHLVFDVPYPERSSRLTTLFRGLLVIPQAIVIFFVGVALLLVSTLAWLAIVITGRHPRGLWDFAYMALRWTANVNCYINYLRDEYPPFGSGAYPVVFELPYPESSSRLKALVRSLLLIPHAIMLNVLLSVLSFAQFFALIAILFTGRYPRGLYGFVVGVTRWQMRVAVYAHYLTDAYPPFSTQ